MPRDLVDDVRDFSDEQGSDFVGQMTLEDEQRFLEEARNMILIREQKKAITTQEASSRKVLTELIEKYGSQEGADGQHLAIPLDPPIRGVAAIVRQRKTSQRVDEDTAAVIAKARGIYERLFKPVMTLDEDEVLVALREDLLTESEVAEIFPVSETYAITLRKDK